MKVLIICGVFAKEHETEVVKHAKGPVEFSANVFQQKLIEGFRIQQCDMQVLSAPFIGAYPMRSDWFYFREFEIPSNKVDYIPFSNVWGIRNISRTSSLRKAVKSFAKTSADKKMILVYCPHTPFLEAAAYAKKIDPEIKICLYVPDLPDYMNLRSDRSRIYNIAKKADIFRMHQLMEDVDSFVLLTEPMRNMLPIGNKPYIVREGIVSELPGRTRSVPDVQGIKNIVYTGKMDAAFGILDLIQGFREISDNKYRLILCGSGDCDEEVKRAAREDDRIVAAGQLLPDEVKRWQQSATVLVNPRTNNGEYTKYSFPSKNIEYLLTGKPVVAFMLDGMPEIYKEFIYQANPQKPVRAAIVEALRNAVEDTPENWEKKHNAFVQYIKERLSAVSIAKSILNQLV